MSNNENFPRPIVSPWHLLMFGALVIASMIFTQKKDAPLSLGTFTNDEKQPTWQFLGGKVKMFAEPLAGNKIEGVFEKLTIQIDGNDYAFNESYEYITNRGTLPVVRELADSTLEILLGLRNMPNEKIMLLNYNGKRFVREHLIPFFRGGHKDLDGDGVAEFMGFLEDYGDYCKNCDTVFYNPLQIYEMRENGFELDETATKNWIENHYSEFKGLDPNKKLLVTLKKPINEIIK